MPSIFFYVSFFFSSAGRHLLCFAQGNHKSGTWGHYRSFQYQVNIESVCSVFFFRCTAKTRGELSDFLLAFLNGFVTGCSYRRFRDGEKGRRMEQIRSCSVISVCIYCACAVCVILACSTDGATAYYGVFMCPTVGRICLLTLSRVPRRFWVRKLGTS